MRTLSFSIPPFSAMILGTWTTWFFRTWDIAAYHAHSTCFQARQKVWLVKRVDFDELQTSWRRFFWRFLPLDLNCGNADFRPGGQLFTWTMTNAGSFAWQSNNKRKYITLDYEEEFELSPRKGRVCWLCMEPETATEEGKTLLREKKPRLCGELWNHPQGKEEFAKQEKVWFWLRRWRHHGCT